MEKRVASGGGLPVEAIRHQDTRVNIPTEELRGFVAEEETAYTTMLYPRDPSLDPQLVWRGKDEQDAADLEVPVVPIYIQEKINPQALIADLKRSRNGAADAVEQIDFFADFSGLEEDFGRAVEFYQHDQHWSNRMILGDSLLAMTSLAEKEGMKGKVQTIYLDPPYGIRFGSNWQVSTRKRDVKDGRMEDATRQPEQVRAFRDTWRVGIHSYVAYMRDRLTVARALLTDAGSIFVQIGDENVHLVRCLLDEVFGSENVVAQIYFVATTGRQEKTLDRLGNYILWYAKDVSQVKFRRIFTRKPGDAAGSNPILGDLQSQGVRSTGSYPVEFEGRTYRPQPGNHWKVTEQGMKRLIAAQRVRATRSVLRYVRHGYDFPVEPLADVWTDTSGGAGTDKIYVVQTSTKLVERCLLMSTDPGDLVLDPTCGSGTSAFVAEQWGRRWITIDTSRVALTLARTRLMAAKYPYYLLTDSPEGVAQQVLDSGLAAPVHQTSGDIRKGFVYRRVPHVTLKSIANNPDIREGMSREEIDAAIARHTETETLYDQPYEDKKIVRVAGPFTVESLSPHRVLAAGDDNLDGRVSPREAAQQGDFASMILENLREAGAQNTRRAERLMFDRLEPYAGTWVHASGEYTDADGQTRRVAVCIGPEHGTVGPHQVREAAKEAMQGIGHDLLLVCGFAFDPHVAEESKRYGRLRVEPTRMNPDLAMGEDLKKTGAANLFMIFGEPEVVISQQDGMVTAEIVGLDVYDPTTGAIRSSDTGNLDYDIAAWFIDTEYDGESFFVRHAYFTGGNEPYDKLKRALRAEIDEEAWASLYGTVSRPFPRPGSGKIAVKVINHYGDEVLKVFGV